YIQYLYRELDKNLVVVSLQFDLTSAFDSVNPSFVCKKLDVYGIRGNINSWIHSYLT
ncbi:hypothetical protein PPYR_15632, partial [Photinus pyralis]